MAREKILKHKTSYALTPDAERWLAALARKLGITRTGILELLIRDKAKREGLR